MFHITKDESDKTSYTISLSIKYFTSMDEVDIESLEDLNELESRLYSQIHHESNTTNENPSAEQEVLSQNIEGISENSRIFPKRRYWTNRENGATVSHQHQPPNNQNQFKQPKASNKSAESVELLGTDKSQEISRNEKPTCKDAKLARVENSSSLKINPAAAWMNRNKVKKPNININTNSKQGPFFKQQQKLERAKRVEDKKQKSRKSAKNRRQTSADVIELLSSDDSDGSDVIIVPKSPTPVFTVEDSEDGGGVEENGGIVNISLLEQEDNALDATDVQLPTSSKFIKPRRENSLQPHSSVAGSCNEKRTEISSRCTSPCSIQSSDDFIVNVDCNRLLETTSGMADDEDLLLLTSDVNSLLETPRNIEQTQNIDAMEGRDNVFSTVTSESTEFATPKTLRGASRKADYRVDQTQFRALDVYESESDITDSVYSKGTHKTTVIRQLDTSSEENEDITCLNSRNKRFRKRRVSSSNKSSDVNYENAQTSDENTEKSESDDANISGAERTGIPFISRGPAVERKMRKRRRTLSTCSVTGKPKKSTNLGHLSDGDFITKLNDLVQGQNDENEGEESDDPSQNVPSARDIAEKVLGQNTTPDVSKNTTLSNKLGTSKARDKKKLNNSVQRQHVEIEIEESDDVVEIGESEETMENNFVEVHEDEALPKDVCDKLGEVFNRIDSMEVRDSKTLVQNKSDAPEANFSRSVKQSSVVYKSISNDPKVQIITYVGDEVRSPKDRKKRSANGSPIYNVIYSRTQKLNGGFGWNNEMRKFYEKTWNGEDLALPAVWQKMNPDKLLWRISIDDRFPKSTRRFKNLKCTNCCEFGHARSHCRRPRKPLICYMCGESGHEEPRCPNTICLRCGNKTQVFIKSCNACSFQNRLICPICKIRGHSIDFCPDKWRRYYSTTEPNAFPNNNIVCNPRRFCSICGHRGHLADMCRSSIHFLEYPVIATAVKSHQKSYGDMAVKSTFSGIGFNLMYDPCEDYSFEMSERTASDKYYGRFLKSVGMEYLVPRKRHLCPPIADSSAKKSKKPATKIEETKKAPNQVQEVSESGSVVDDDDPKETSTGITTSLMHAKSSTGITTPIMQAKSTATDDIQLNVIDPIISQASEFANFKSPNEVVSSSNNPPQIMDSDSNYSFSEHFDIASVSTADTEQGKDESLNEEPAEQTPPLSTSSEALRQTLAVLKQRPKSRPMEALPDFIPLCESTTNRNKNEVQSEQTGCQRSGISRRFVAAETDEESNDGDQRNKDTPSSLPCEAKIYLTHFHSKFLLSLDGRSFLAKTSKACNLKARIDLTSVGHVLIIFGLPPNQDAFQRELLLKYRDLSDQINQKNVQYTPNIPKRSDVLIRFLRDDINQLFNNVGNANHLFKRLQYVERQHSKSGFKMADKIRRSLNMILVGQAGLQDGNIHLDKLLLSLGTLINDNSSDGMVTAQLRNEISSHWKFIFSSFRHDNYQELINAYNRLVSKNRIHNLIIDPLLLGHKVLDTSLTTDQKVKLESRQQTDSNNSNECAKRQIVPNPLTPKSSKQNKRKQSHDMGPVILSSKIGTPIASPAKTQSTQSINCNVQNVSTTVKIKSTTTPTTPISSVSKKNQQKMMPPPPFINPEKRSTVNTGLKQISDNWKSTCDTLLTEIGAKPSGKGNNNARDSKLPSTFWSRESLRYLDECIPIVSTRPELMEKLNRVQSKSKNGQLSYNDYLAVIKLHTALTGK